MNPNPYVRPVAAEEVERSFESQVAEFDAFRSETLLSLVRLREVKTEQTSRQYEQAQKMWGPDDPRTQQFAAELAVNRRFAVELAAEADRAGATAPTVDPRSWMLYGYVRDADLKGQEGLTVALYDAQGRWVNALGHGCTNDRGYFEVRASLNEEIARRAELNAQCFLRVSGPNQETLYNDRSATVPQAAVAEYREIILDGAKPCMPPSATAAIEPPRDPTRPPTTVRGARASAKRAAPKKGSK